MTSFIRKELRSLAMPAALVLAVTLLGALGAAAPRTLPEPVVLGIGMLITLLLFTGVPLVAASSFGAEFHHRTIALVLAQPVSRARVWMGKWLSVAAVLTVLGAATAFELAWLKPGGPPSRMVVPLAPGIMFLVMVACSAPLWTLVARSTIGGLVFTMTAVTMLELASRSISYRLAGTFQPRVLFGPTTPTLEGVRALYSVATFWLGWRVFSRFQDSGAGTGGAWLSASSSWALLRPRRGAAIGNLVRKELMLQRPTFLVAAAFTGCWFLAVLISQPAPYVGDVLMSALLAIYLPGAAVLPGIVSVGEDASLGARAWHLTLPLSWRTQWTIKFVVALLVAAALALVLPSVMMGLADVGANGDLSRVHFLHPFVVGIEAVMLVFGGVVMGLWASTLFGDTIDAAVAALYAVVAFAFVTWLGSWLGAIVADRSDWLVRLLTASSAVRGGSTGGIRLGAAVFIASIPATIVALRQSLAAFRSVQPSRAAAMRLSLAPLAAASVAAFLFAVWATAWLRAH